jgi:preprotein translocase subunit SecG
MYGLLMTGFVILSAFLGFIVLLQQGKGDTGLGGGASQGGQLLFGGSGGETFFTKLTWICGLLFIGGSLLLALYNTKHVSRSVLQDYSAPKEAPIKPGK